MYPHRFLVVQNRKATNTMKGPWESIACGREKGFQTQKLDVKPSHCQQRVWSVWRGVNYVAHFEEIEGCSWADWRGHWYDPLREALDGYSEGIFWWCGVIFVGWRQQHRKEDVQVCQEASRFQPLWLMCSFILIRELLLREMLSRSCMPRCVVLIITTKCNENSRRVCIVCVFVRSNSHNVLDSPHNFLPSFLSSLLP